MEKCLTIKTIPEHRELLTNKYPFMKEKISTIIKKYE